MKAIEMIKAVALTPAEWTVENGFLTAANKMKRPTITQHFAKDIEALYKGLEAQYSHG